MTKFLTHTTDVQGNRYLVVKFDKNVDSSISHFLNLLKSKLGDDFDTFVSNQKKRDSRDGQSHTHHITVINAMDFKEVYDKLGKFMSEPIDDLEMLGIGTAKDDKRGNQTFFIVCQSKKLDTIRKSVGLKPIDFHITIGFDKKDVFGKSKGKDSLIDL